MPRPLATRNKGLSEGTGAPPSIVFGKKMDARFRAEWIKDDLHAILMLGSNNDSLHLKSPTETATPIVDLPNVAPNPRVSTTPPSHLPPVTNTQIGHCPERLQERTLLDGLRRHLKWLLFVAIVALYLWMVPHWLDASWAASHLQEVTEWIMVFVCLDSDGRHLCV